ncbi:MAG: biopolymer transporter ExbD [Bdellovibrionaceae bacterium]|nr:biopolymer transporter ExbD [Pseudobdellovibrionaceae bacterium]MDW8189799.1 biopolymer transporter ExbD [Pseudobdellovibrionaceae bacterium]
MYRRKNFQYMEVPKRFTLNITSMADMFTILLVFLLQNYSLSEVKVDLVPNLKLPVSASFINPKKLPIIYVSKDEIRLGDKTITKVSDINPKVPQIPELLSALQEEQGRLQGIQKTSGEIILQADRDHSYQIIQKVMHTLSVAGFPKVKLATLSGE